MESSKAGPMLMMKGDKDMKKTIKSYYENGMQYRFNKEAFHILINRKKYDNSASGKKVTQMMIWEEIADRVSVSVDAVKSWFYGNNGPSDLEQIGELGKYLGIDYHQLLEKEHEEMANNTSKNVIVVQSWQEEQTKACIRKIYRAMLHYIKRCRYYYQNNFNPDPDGDPFNPEYMKAMDIARLELTGCFQTIVDELEDSMLDLSPEMYDKIYEFTWMELNDYIDVLTENGKDILEGVGTDDPDSSEVKKVLEHMDIYDDMVAEYMAKTFEGDYIQQLRDFFGDYTVK